MLNFVLGMMLGALLSFVFIGAVTLMTEEDERIEREIRQDLTVSKRVQAGHNQELSGSKRIPSRQRTKYCGQEGGCLIWDCLFCEDRGKTEE